MSAAASRPNGVITLLTDFGVTDTYVGAIKGAILAINPKATLVDLTHGVPPQDIHTGAFLLSTSYDTYPAGTIHLCVVDPSVGTKRKPLLLVGKARYFVGPDNGLFNYILYPNFVESESNMDLFEPFAGPVPTGFKAYQLDKSEYWRSKVSTTFHARDIFGPVAAHLAAGVPPQKLGSLVQQITALYAPQPKATKSGLEGYVLHVDTYGNLFTNISGADLGKRTVKTVGAGGKIIEGLSATYAASSGLVAILDSQGLLEIAVRNGSASKQLKVGKGTKVTVSF